MRLRNRGFSAGFIVIVFLCAVSVAGAQTIISPTSWSVPAGGGTQTVGIATARSDGAWTASSDQAWLTVSPANGTGSGSVTLTALALTSVATRRASVTLGGQTIAVTQSPREASSVIVRRSAEPVIVTVNFVDDSTAVIVNGIARLNVPSSSNTPHSVDVTPYLSGDGDIVQLDVANAGAGWSYNWSLSVNGATVLGDACGTWNAYLGGCISNDSTTGLVYRHTVYLLVDPQIAVSPASWSVPAGGGTQNIAVATTVESEPWVASAAPAVTTVSGSTAGTASFADGIGTDARFAYPNHLAADAAGNVFVADWGNNRIRKVTPGGAVTTFAGSGAAGGADGTGTAASFDGPRGIAIDASGTLYVAESWGHRIRKITPETVVTTVAGNGDPGYVDAQGANARFWYPSGIAVDGDGNLYVTEEHNSTVRKITPAGNVTTLAGNGTAGYVDATGTEARFNLPFGVAVDAAGNVYVADSLNHRIRKVTPTGVVTTVAGSGTPGAADGIGTAAQFNEPWGLTVDTAGNVYVADPGNHLIRRIGLDGIVTTLAGSSGGYADGTVTVARFAQPVGVALTTSGSVLIVSERELGNRIRRVTLGANWISVSPAGGTGSGSVTLTAEASSRPFPRTASLTIAGHVVTVNQAGATSAMSVSPETLDFGSLIVGGSSVDQPITITNTGDVTLSGWQWNFGGLGNPVGGTCGSAAANPDGLYSLTPGQSCTFVLRFTPGSLGQQGGALSVGMKSAPDGEFDVAWNGTWTALVIAPPTAGTISGTVMDAGAGSPIAGVTVEIYDAFGGSQGSVVTNASGIYEKTGLPAGTYVRTDLEQSGVRRRVI